MDRDFITTYVKAVDHIDNSIKSYTCIADSVMVTGDYRGISVGEEDWTYLTKAYNDKVSNRYVSSGKVNHLSSGQSYDTFSVLVSLLNTMHESASKHYNKSVRPVMSGSVRGIAESNGAVVIWNSDNIHVLGITMSLHSILQITCADISNSDPDFRLGDDELVLVREFLRKQDTSSLLFDEPALGTKIAFKADHVNSYVLAKRRDVEGFFKWVEGHGVLKGEDTLVFMLIYNLIKMTEDVPESPMQDIYDELQKRLTGYLRKLQFKEIESPTLDEVFRLLRVTNIDVNPLVLILRDVT